MRLLVALLVVACVSAVSLDARGPYLDAPLEDPYADYVKEQKSMVTPDPQDQDDILVANNARVSLDHGLPPDPTLDDIAKQNDYGSAGMSKTAQSAINKAAPSVPSSSSSSSISQALQPNSRSSSKSGSSSASSAASSGSASVASSGSRARFSEVPAPKNCGIPGNRRVAAHHVVANYPAWNNEVSIQDNVNIMRDACLRSKIGNRACFDERDRDAPWCYWAESNCNVKLYKRQDATKLIDYFPMFGSKAEQQDACRNNGYCWDENMSPNCFDALI